MKKEFKDTKKVFRLTDRYDGAPTTRIPDIPPTHFAVKKARYQIDFQRPMLQICTKNTTQTIDLSKLQKAEYIAWINDGPASSPMDLTLPSGERKRVMFTMQGLRARLELEDTENTKLELYFSMFDDNDLDALAECIRPYILAQGVDRNFADLPIYESPHMDPKPLLPWYKLIIRALLFIILPAIVLTAIIVIVAIFTHQPTFR